MMTIGSYISSYRAEHKISLRSFAAAVDLSPTYVSRLERGIGSTGKVPCPTIEVYKKVAAVTGVTLDQLCLICEDDTVTVNSDDSLSRLFSAPSEPKSPPSLLDELDKQIIELFRALDDKNKQKALGYLEALADTHK